MRRVLLFTFLLQLPLSVLSHDGKSALSVLPIAPSLSSGKSENLPPSVLSVPGNSEIEVVVVPVAETEIAFTDEAEREEASLQKFQNFRGGIKDDKKLQIKDDKELVVAGYQIKERKAVGKDERMDDVLKSLLAKERATKKEQIGKAVDEARRNFRSEKSSTSNPQTMLDRLMHTLKSDERLSDLFSDKDIQRTFFQAQTQISDEDKQLERELAKLDAKQMEEALGILLSEGEAADSERYKRHLEIAENDVNAEVQNAESLMMYFKNPNLQRMVRHRLSKLFTERYDRADILSGATNMLGQLRSDPKYEKYDNDGLMIKILEKAKEEKKSPLKNANIEKAVQNARKTVTLANAVRLRKLDALRKLVEEYGDLGAGIFGVKEPAKPAAPEPSAPGKYAHQYLVLLAAKLEHLDALKVLLDLSKNDKLDAKAALRVLVKRRVDAEIDAMVRPPRGTETTPLEANREMIEYLVEDMRITGGARREIGATVITREAPTVRQMWDELMILKKERESEDKKRRVKEKSKGGKGWKGWRNSKSSVDVLGRSKNSKAWNWRKSKSSVDVLEGSKKSKAWNWS